MSAPWIELLTDNLPPEEKGKARLELRNVLNAAARVGQWDRTKTGSIVGELIDPSGHVRIDGAGVHVYSGTAQTTWIQSDGDIFIGSNVAAAATTNFVFLSTAQTYNSESLGAGDLLIGDNSSGKANMLWDASTGQLLFRGGTTTQGYVDVDGSASFGGGAVLLNSTGVNMTAGDGAVYRLKWNCPDDTTIGFLQTNAAVAAGKHAGLIQLRADAESGYTANSGSTITLQTLVRDSGDAAISASYLALSPTQILQILYDASGAILNSTLWGRLYTMLNSNGNDVDTIIQGDTATNLVVVDAGLDAVQIGTTTAGVIADFRATGIILNEAGADADIRAESNGNANMLFVDGGADFVGVGTGTPSAKLHIVNTDAAASTNLTLGMDAYGDAVRHVFRRAQGTPGSETQVLSGQTIGNLNFRGWHSGGAFATGTNAAMLVIAAEDFTSTTMGTRIELHVTPVGSATSAAAFTVQDDGTIKLNNANSWTANGTGTVTISNLAPAGVGTATIGKWLTITDNAGVVYYIPAFT